MRWVTYLSPSGGVARAGVLDEGYVFAHPGPQTLAELLRDGRQALDEESRRALDEPAAIIMEFEARLCAPLVPQGGIAITRADGAATEMPPSVVRGPDDGVGPPAEATPLRAAAGMALVAVGADGHLLTLACLWTSPAGQSLTLGPAVVMPPPGVVGMADTVTVLTEVDGRAWSTVLEPPSPPGAGGCSVALGIGSDDLEPGHELRVESEEIGEFEIRVGALA
jgi:hypothetical protein